MDGSELSIFADDIVLYASARNERFVCAILQEAVDGIIGWASKWRLNVNRGKCVVVRLTKRTRPIYENVEIEKSLLDDITSTSRVDVCHRRGKLAL